MIQKLLAIVFIASGVAFSLNAQPPARLLPQLGTLDNLYLVNTKDSIFRSKQPQAADFLMLVEKYHIRSILKLNAEDPENLNTTGLALNVVPLYYDRAPGKELSIALKTLHSTPKPVLVHCHAGVDRTGLVIALYRIIFEKWSREKAGAEMKNTSGWNNHEPLTNYFNSFNIDSMRMEVLIDPITVDNTHLGPQSEISGTLVNKSGCYLLKEKEADLVQLDTNFNYKRTIHLTEKGISGPRELEGMAVYKHHMLITNETRGNVCVYDYNLEKDRVFKIQPDYLQNDYGNRGIEGIAVNGTTCYIMKERNHNYQSVLKIYQITEAANDQLKFQFIDSMVFDHRTTRGTPESWRYSDIYYDPELKRLLCLKSLYTADRKEYRIDLVDLTDETLTSQNKIYTYSFESFDLTYKIQNLKQEDPLINSNLEALTTWNKRIYLLSDNYYLPEDLNSKTLFLVADILK